MIRNLILAGWLALLTPSLAIAKDNQSPAARAIASFDSRHHPEISQNGMVSAQDRLAAEVGRDILKRGGNAIDAAVATGFALAVTHPQAGNLGGGGFMMISLEGREQVIALDFREIAPAAAHRDMYLDVNGDVDNQKSQYSHLSAGVPGTVMGLLEALDRYGTMSRRQVIGPAIRLADRGFEVSAALENAIDEHREILAQDPSSSDYFLGLTSGEKFRQDDLADTLRRIVTDGSDGFYKGKTAALIVEEMQNNGGLITAQDLESYDIIVRDAVSGDYNGYEVASMPPPSSGGIHIIQMLNILSEFDLKSDGHNSAAYIHKLAESMRRAFADRSKYLGDPAFYDVPVDALTDPNYGTYLAGTIDPETASLSTDIAPAQKLPFESNQTTHYSVIDKDGNAVGVTYTLNFSFGSGYSVDGAGFLLNNEMDDFSAKPGSPNGYGLIGGTANQIAPGKRPLSSMTPVIVKKDGEVVLVTGSPGGSTIITTVLQVILNVTLWDMNLAEATHVPRIHHQWLPDTLILEPGISQDTVDLLEDRGHRLVRGADDLIGWTTLGRVNSVGQSGDLFFGAADPRGPKSAALGY